MVPKAFLKKAGTWGQEQTSLVSTPSGVTSLLPLHPREKDSHPGVAGWSRLEVEHGQREPVPTCHQAQLCYRLSGPSLRAWGGWASLAFGIFQKGPARHEVWRLCGHKDLLVTEGQ